MCLKITPLVYILDFSKCVYFRQNKIVDKMYLYFINNLVRLCPDSLFRVKATIRTKSNLEIPPKMYIIYRVKLKRKAYVN